VEEYTRAFERLVITCDHRESEHHTIIRYIGGLNESLRNIVELQHYTILDEVCSLAHKVELQKKAELKKEPPKPLTCRCPFNKASYRLPLKPQNPTSGPSNHKPNDPRPPLNLYEKRRCHKCHSFGHIALECSNRKVINLVEYQTLEEAKCGETGSDKEVHLMEAVKEHVEETDEGELLLLRRALNGHKGANHEEQRENIFHTRCTINGQVCSLIVDGGSCANVASTTLKEKLNLKPEPQPQPYFIQWLNQGKGLHVSHLCLISFSIGKSYYDELWCDIIPMDAYHILSRRPWLYDRKVMHDGFLNTYTLHKDGRKITLAPLAPRQITKPKTKETSKDGDVYLSFLEPTLQAEHHEYKPFKEMILLTPSQNDQIESPSHFLAIQLLRSFSMSSPMRFPLDFPQKEPYNTRLISFLEPSSLINLLIG